MTHKTSKLVSHITTVREITVDRPETSIGFCVIQKDSGSTEVQPRRIAEMTNVYRSFRSTRNTPTHVTRR